MILGKRIDITSILEKSKSIEVVAQWIGSSNVVRNRKIKQLEKDEFKDLNYSYAFIRKGLDFLKDVPPEVLRNSAKSATVDAIAYKKDLRGKPKCRGRDKKRKAVITNELFSVQELKDNKSKIIFYTRKNKSKELFYVFVGVPHDKLSKQFSITRIKDKFYLSISFSDGKETLSNEQLLHDFGYLSEEELLKDSIGIDRGVAVNAYLSNGNNIAFSLAERDELKRIEEKIRKKQRYAEKQRRHHRRISKRHNKNLKENKSDREPIDISVVSKRQKRTREQIAKLHRKAKNIRSNFNHHASKAIVAQTPKICVMEDLKIKNMTKKAKPKLSENGKHYVKNNKKQKSGLNKALLNVNLYQLRIMTEYKLNQQNKAMYLVPPHNTSVECSACNSFNTKRTTQALTVCLDCGENHQADFNASKNIKVKGVRNLLTNPPSQKKKKKIVHHKKRAVRETGEPRLSIIKSLERSEGIQNHGEPVMPLRWGSCISGFEKAINIP